MAETYFNYILSQCKLQNLRVVSSLFPTTQSLRDKAGEEFIGCKCIVSDRILLQSLSSFLQIDSFVKLAHYNQDAMIIYTRCKDALLSANSLDYEYLFDRLVDLNWLLASIYRCNSNGQDTVSLLSDSIWLRKALRDYLTQLYNDAIQESKKTIYIQDVLQARKKIFTGLKIQYKESHKYLSFSNMELNDMLNDSKEYGIVEMALFFGLTATSFLSYNIQKGGASEIR